MQQKPLLVLVCVFTLISPYSRPILAQERDQAGKPKLSKAEMVQFQALDSLVDAIVSAKEPLPSDLKLEFRNHFVKSTNNVFVPYSLEVTGGKLGSFPVGMYVRAVRKSEPAEAAQPTPESGAAKKATDYAFENVYFFTDSKSFASSGGNATEINRALELSPGDYDVYIALSEAPPKARGAAPKRAVLVQSLTVPDLGTALTTSSVFKAKTMDEVAQPLTPQQQLEQPFTLGGYRIAPSFDAPFQKSGDFSFFFFIYNEGPGPDDKPDLVVDCNLFRGAEGRPFSKLPAMLFNATTLPAEFKLSAGHQVVVAQGFPLGSFAPGEYKLEVKVTDKIGGQTVLRNVQFTVIP